jgi:hypothetical protein
MHVYRLCTASCYGKSVRAATVELSRKTCILPGNNKMPCISGKSKLEDASQLGEDKCFLKGGAAGPGYPRLGKEAEQRAR